jgi:hypothetical protein
MARFAMILWCGIGGQCLAYGLNHVARWLTVSDKRRVWLAMEAPLHMLAGFFFGAATILLVEHFHKSKPSRSSN